MQHNIIYIHYLSKSNSFSDCIRLIQNDFIFVAVKHILPKHSSKVIIHIGADVIELTNEGVFDPISNRLEKKA